MSDVDAEQPAKRLSLWEWIRQNDIVILIIVGLITVTCTRMATHVDEHYVQPNVNKLLQIKPNDKPHGLKLLLQFVVIMIIIYIVVEYVLKPKAPISSYLLPDAVSRVKDEGPAAGPGPSQGGSAQTQSSPAHSAFGKSFFRPPKPSVQDDDLF